MRWQWRFEWNSFPPPASPQVQLGTNEVKRWVAMRWFAEDHTCGVFVLIKFSHCARISPSSYYFDMDKGMTVRIVSCCVTSLQTVRWTSFPFVLQINSNSFQLVHIASIATSFFPISIISFNLDFFLCWELSKLGSIINGFISIPFNSTCNNFSTRAHLHIAWSALRV